MKKKLSHKKKDSSQFEKSKKISLEIKKIIANQEKIQKEIQKQYMVYQK